MPGEINNTRIIETVKREYKYLAIKATSDELYTLLLNQSDRKLNQYCHVIIRIITNEINHRFEQNLLDDKIKILLLSFTQLLDYFNPNNVATVNLGPMAPFFLKQSLLFIPNLHYPYSIFMLSKLAEEQTITDEKWIDSLYQIYITNPLYVHLLAFSQSPKLRSLALIVLNKKKRKMSSIIEINSIDRLNSALQESWFDQFISQTNLVIDSSYDILSNTIPIAKYLSKLHVELENTQFRMQLLWQFHQERGVLPTRFINIEYLKYLNSSSHLQNKLVVIGNWDYLGTNFDKYLKQIININEGKFCIQIVGARSKLQLLRNLQKVRKSTKQPWDEQVILLCHGNQDYISLDKLGHFTSTNPSSTLFQQCKEKYFPELTTISSISCFGSTVLENWVNNGNINYFESTIMATYPKKIWLDSKGVTRITFNYKNSNKNNLDKTLLSRLYSIFSGSISS